MSSSYLANIKLSAAQKQAIAANNQLKFLAAITRTKEAAYVPAAQQFAASIGTGQYKNDPWYTTNTDFRNLVDRFITKTTITSNLAGIAIFVHSVATFMAACKGKPSASKNVLALLDNDSFDLYNLGYPNFYAIRKRKYGSGEFGLQSAHYKTIKSVISQATLPDIITGNGALNHNSNDYPVYLVLVRALRSLFHNCKLA